MRKRHLRRIEDLEIQVEQLTCPHIITEFLVSISRIPENGLRYLEQCVTCGKNVNVWHDELEYLKADLKAKQGQADDTKKRIKQIESEGKG